MQPPGFGRGQQHDTVNSQIAEKNEIHIDYHGNPTHSFPGMTAQHNGAGME
jgi:hypothetical protein